MPHDTQAPSPVQYVVDALYMRMQSGYISNDDVTAILEPYVSEAARSVMETVVEGRRKRE